MNDYLLAIETSCDETAAAVFTLTEDVRSAGKMLCAEVVSSQIKAHQPYGGVVPELASREHIRNLPLVVDQVLAQSAIKLEDLGLIAVTRGPGLKGCLLVGLGYAKGLAYAKGIPLQGINHLEAHLASCFLMPREEQPEFPCLVLLVSGGHTSLILWQERRRYKIIAETRDDAAGEAFDKVATLLGFPYPGGPSLAKAAAEAGDKLDQQFRFPVGLPKDRESFSFSGFKTSVQRKVREMGHIDAQQRTLLAAAAQEAIVTALVSKLELALDEQKVASVFLTGGVAANERLRSRLREVASKRELKVAMPPSKWCTDNAAMVGACALGIYSQNVDSYRKWQPKNTSHLLGPEAPFDLGALARWPLEEVV